jgi:hypothetical protein
MTILDILATSSTSTLTQAAQRAIDTLGYGPGITRRAHPHRCHKCGAWTVRGLDADWAATDAICDPSALSALGEALAQLRPPQRFQGQTYALVRYSRYELERRDAGRIADKPAGSPRQDVLRSHVCHDRPLSEAETLPSAFTAALPCPCHPSPCTCPPPF